MLVARFRMLRSASQGAMRQQRQQRTQSVKEIRKNQENKAVVSDVFGQWFLIFLLPIAINSWRRHRPSRRRQEKQLRSTRISKATLLFRLCEHSTNLLPVLRSVYSWLLVLLLFSSVLWTFWRKSWIRRWLGLFFQSSCRVYQRGSRWLAVGWTSLETCVQFDAIFFWWGLTKFHSRLEFL